MKRSLKNMSTKKYLLLAAVPLAAVVLLAGGYLAVRQQPAAPLTPLPAPQAVVSMTADGFEPASLTISPGTTVVWTNADGAPHLVASNPHPEHSDYPGLDAGQPTDPESSYSFTFAERGTYGYHDDLDPTKNGTIIVKDQGDGFTD